MGKLFYHLPPTAVHIEVRDLKAGLRALIDPEGSYQEFMAALVDRTGSSNCFLTASGRSALLVILLSLKRRSPRTKVILPAYTCPTVAQSVLQAGLQPVFCDVSADTLDMDRSFLEELLDDQTLAIIPTHLYGLVQDLADLVDIAHRMGISIIEDAAQAFGAEIHGNSIGNAGDFGFFSMGWGKCLPTGHGGIILAKDSFASDLEKTIHEMIPGRGKRDIAVITKFLAYGMATTPMGWWFMVHSPLNPANAGMDRTKLQPIQLSHLSPAQAGIGESILSRIDQINAVRRRNSQILVNLISNYQFVTIPKVPPGGRSVYLRFPIIIEDKHLADSLFQVLSKAGIGVSRSYVRTLPDIFSSYDFAPPERFPGAERLADCLLTLPTHHLVKEDDIARIKTVFDSIDPK